MIAKDKIGLSENDFTGKFGILVEVNPLRREPGMHSNDSVQGHDWVWLQNKVFGVPFLGLGGIVPRLLILVRHFRALSNVFRFEV